MCNMPPSRLSISSVAFSLSRLNTRSPGRTASPSCFNQPANVPSSMFQPRRGMVIGIGMALSLGYQFADRLGDGFLVRHDGGLQRRAVRRRAVDAVEPADRRVEVV